MCRSITTIALLLSFLFLTALPLRAERTLTVGIYQNPPLVFFEDPERPEGLFIDILKEIAREENLNLTYRACRWKDCLELLKRGVIDIQTAIAYTPERARWALFTDEDVIVNWAIICKRHNLKISTFPDLEGKRVALVEGDVYLEPFLKTVSSFGITINPLYYRGYEELFEAITKGEADAALVNRLFESQKISSYPLVEPTPIVFSPVKIKFALSKRAGLKVKALLDSHLKRLKEDRDSPYYQSLDRWLSTPKTYYVPKWLYVLLGVLIGLLVALFFSTYAINKKLLTVKGELRERYDELNQTKQYLEALFHNSPDMIFVHDETGAVVDVNQKVVDTYGFTLEDFKTLPPETMMGKGFSAEMAIARIKEALQGKALEFQWIARDRKDREFPVEVRLRPFELSLLEGSSKRYVLAIVRDITEKIEAQERIKKSEQWFRTIFYEEPECVKIVSPDGRLIDMNPAGLRMIGLDSVEPIKGKSCLLIVHEDHREQYSAFMKELLKGKQSSLEFKIKTLDGKIKWVESHATPVKDETGRLQAIVAVTRDITEKKHLQEELERKVKERTENLQRIINTLSQRELRMAELKEVIRKLRAQLKEAGLEPVADDPLKEQEGK